jgi:hypothetical protein
MLVGAVDLRIQRTQVMNWMTQAWRSSKNLSYWAPERLLDTKPATLQQASEICSSIKVYKCHMTE